MQQPAGAAEAGGGEEGPSDAYLTDVITNFVLAGRDTSAVALTWFFYELSRHPDAEAKIVEELNGVLRARAQQPNGSEPDSGAAAEFTDGDTFTYEELKEMPYLQAALSEAMRLYPPVPSDQKYCVDDDVLPDGTRVPRGSRICYDMYGMARLERVWGPDCRAFRPERWLKDGQFVPVSPYKYPVFNAGPRTCLGRDLAYLLMKSVVAATLRFFRVRVREGYTARYRKTLTLHMEGGLPVTVERR